MLILYTRNDLYQMCCIKLKIQELGNWGAPLLLSMELVSLCARHRTGNCQTIMMILLRSFSQLMYIHDVGWQVPALAMLFFTLGCGNIITTSMTIPLKLNDSKTGLLKYRFTRLDKYFWNHRKRRNSISKVNDYKIKSSNQF